ncbi:hypothetical protein BC833DRAFT_130050 [Globomyces pollinis-pini]|nr:hypothetical protein BC833DRAFT_130050 [Globomyces pollinis-pini]
MVHQHSDNCCSTSAKIPTRAILTKEDLERFQESESHSDFMDFITLLNEAIKNKPLSHDCYKSANILKILDLLDIIAGWISEIPPEDVGLSRFGNPSFRIWYDRLKEEMSSLLEGLVATDFISEVGTYLLSSFGDRKRIDYGTGHEANFICFLLCLRKLQVLNENDLEAAVISVFWKYIQVMRQLQSTYWLEPAGSHGVWGLDDYQFLPFLFGAGQLAEHKYLRPKSIHDKDILEEIGNDYMYLSCIMHINSVLYNVCTNYQIKTATLRWHSPMLDDISGVKKWEKVNSGMFKMYRAEVLNKLPVMQHFLFGSLIPFVGSASEMDLSEEQEHVHAFGQERPLCCTIRVPSLVATKQSQMRRPLPFD